MEGPTEPTQEKKITKKKEEISPRNLRTHFDETLAAMGEIEGTEWLSHQGENQMHAWHRNVAAAVRRLRSRKHGFFIVEGAMVNRWLVELDGRVIFLENVKAGGAGDAAKARESGFEVRTDVLDVK